MSNDTPKEGVVIDVTPEQEAPTETGTPPEQQAPAASTGRGLSWLAVLLGAGALGLTLAGGWYGYQQRQDLEQRLSATRAEGDSTVGKTRDLTAQLTHIDQAQQALRGHLTSLSSDLQRSNDKLAAVQQDFDAQTDRLNSERRLLDEREAELRSLVAGLHEKVGRSGSQWLVAEAGYLLNLAEYRLRLARDPATARAALALADDRLLATGDPGWAGVREQIARDLTRLDTLQQPDVTGLWSRLGALLEQVPELKLREGARGVSRGLTRTDTPATPSEQRSWRTLLSDLWTGIKNSVRIRRHDEPVAALLPPEQEYFLFENLRLRLEQARLAMVQGRDPIYRQALAEARAWLAQHFDGNDAVTQALDKALAELAGSAIRVELPDISPSISAFQARRELLRALPAPLPPPGGTAPAAAQEAPSA